MRVVVVVVALAVAGTTLAIAPHAAHAEISAAELEFGIGAKIHTGPIAADYQWSLSFRTLAALQPLRLGDVGRMGAAWWWQIDSFGKPAARATGGPLQMSHLGLGLRAELIVPGVPSLDVNLLVGLELVRSSPPVPPDDKAHYWGPMIGGGLEWAVSSQFAVVFNVSYGTISNGPSGVTMLISALVGGP